MSKLKITTAIVVIIVLLFAGWLLFRGTETVNERNYPPYIKSYSYGFGMLRIDDSEANVVLFSYHNDAAVKPVRIEKTGEGQWTVVFEKRKP